MGNLPKQFVKKEYEENVGGTIIILCVPKNTQDTIEVYCDVEIMDNQVSKWKCKNKPYSDKCMWLDNKNKCSKNITTNKLSNTFTYTISYYVSNILSYTVSH